MSRMTLKFVFVSASYSFTKCRSLRANNRQSMRRMSSPGMYARCSAKSVEAPSSGDRCRPLMNPSTTVRANNSRFPIRASTDGSRYEVVGSAGAVMLVAGWWLLVGGCWLLVAGCYSSAGALRMTNTSHAGLRQRNDLQQFLDDLIGRDLLRF